MWDEKVFERLVWRSRTFLVERRVPGQQEVVWLEAGASLHSAGLRSSTLQAHHGLHIEPHQLPVQILQTPVIWGCDRHGQDQSSGCWSSSAAALIMCQDGFSADYSVCVRRTEGISSALVLLRDRAREQVKATRTLMWSSVRSWLTSADSTSSIRDTDICSDGNVNVPLTPIEHLFTQALFRVCWTRTEGVSEVLLDYGALEPVIYDSHGD